VKILATTTEFSY